MTLTSSNTVDFYQRRKHGKYRLVSAPKLGPVADTHCHLEMLEDPAWAFIRCALHNVTFVCCVIDSVDDGQAGIDIVEEAYDKAKSELPKVLENLDDYCQDKNSICDDPKIPELRYIIGCHPHYAKDFNDDIYELIKNPKCVAVGEIGLDFHYDLSPREVQIEVFKKQLKIAEEAKLPVSLHIREAHDVALDNIKFSKYGTLLHCFNLGPEELKPWVDAGCYIALGGPVTFKKSDNVREALKYIPEDKLVTETDAPFMAPEPLRGDVCYPDYVIFTANFLGRDLNQLMDNARRLLWRP
ncbi:MAG: TatD family hydrolase [Coriobacteriia bacterium]|nr:TatD family hydrolase [Coriobacteriia bacterium]